MVSSVSNTTSNTTVNTGTALQSAGQLSADAQQDRFLKLLVAQLNNQDPMNPMDNAQMTSQMAQINTVSGINQLNETVKSLSSQFAALQVMQGAGMIGHDVMLKSNTLSVSDGKAKGAVSLSANADKVSVQILTPGGKLLDTVNLGAMTAGQHSFTWDASKYQGTASPVFKIVATSGKQAVDATALAQDTVTAVGSDNGSMSIQLKGREAVAYSDVQSIL
jgi:flagellar basal-body rod modification protein FlgD